ncbi:DUF6011 domain-containing protein, partial [Streptomyces ipomoeae]|uniref:DUF6011 domain-containing protein n=1 Tax=Streptomyces ipomoeae TaxID=103232 RepID=UPI0038D35700
MPRPRGRQDREPGRAAAGGPVSEPVVLCPCGRRLRTPESRAAGIGPVCARKLTGSPQQPRTGAPAPRLPPKPPQRPTGAP